MKAKQITDLESYFTTDNEHWNEYTFETLCETLQQGQFEDPEQPLQLFSKAVELFTGHHEQPLKAVQLFTKEVDKTKLKDHQKIFVYERVCKYLEDSEFDFDHTPILELLNSQKKKLKADNIPPQPMTKNIREILKGLMQKELETLPETLKELEPLQRLNILCKLMPFVLPKVESVHHTTNEPSETGFTW